mmetsp:Transcript_14610/g.35265  ORF Transcript_14610/g.35265 Transcript_14610/m.35265 type:complete len:207 (-) Transcript_14610:405-1025(-)
MKRSRLISHGDDQLIQAEKRQKKANTRNNLLSQQNDKRTVADTKKSNDGRLSLLSLVCNEITANTGSKPQGQAQDQVRGNNVKIPQKISVAAAEESANNKKKTTNEVFSKSVERQYGITTRPIVISPSEDENTDRHNADTNQEEPMLSSKLPSKNQSETSSKTQEEEKEEPPRIWKEVCRPIPLPPRLPMVPAGYIFPLARPPNRI